MIFTDTQIKDLYIIEPVILTDERGSFIRSFCKEEFQKRGLETNIVQCDISFNKKKGTIRGMHYQVSPFEEAKIVSCSKGSIYDVVVDLRQDSATYGQWVATELCEKKFKMLYIPKGCAHGFQTLEENSVVYYQMGEYYHPECSTGIRWNDPAIGIAWEHPITCISEKDQLYPDFIL